MAEISRPIDKEFNVENTGGRFSTTFLNDLVDTHTRKIQVMLDRGIIT